MRSGICKLVDRRRVVFPAFLLAVCFGMFFAGARPGIAQDSAALSTMATVSSSSPFRVGERLTYNVSFGKFTNAAFFETSVVSRGKLSGQEVVELHSKVKTVGFVSAAFFPIDEDRTVYASPFTGYPIYVKKTDHGGPLPKEFVANYLGAPTSNFDLLTLLYKAREMSGSGSFPLFENDQVYTVVFQNTVGEKVETEAGDFDTTSVTVQGDYFTAIGIKDLKINFTNDEFHYPVQIRFKTSKAVFRASLLALQLPPTPVAPLPTMVPNSTPVPPASPKPTVTPTPYIDNQPLLPELGFALGESLNYKITEGGKPSAVITLLAKERKLFKSVDSLLLTATVTAVEPGNTRFVVGDSVSVQVDPETLAPRWSEIRFTGAFKDLSQTVDFDKLSGGITVSGAKPVEAPIGTHTILSLLYAMRSFNLRPSKDLGNHVNDTRVAVFWDTLPYVFTLRPANPEELVVNGQKVPAQLVSINTGNETLDKLGLKVWLSVDDRIPLRASVGNFQADLISPAAQIK